MNCRLLLAAAALVLAAGLSYLALRHRAGEALAVVGPSRGTAIRAVYATGTVEPTVMIPVAPRIGAKLVELAADEGAEVARGQLLARLEDTDLQKAVEEAAARETLAAAEWKRISALRKSNSASRAEADQAKAELESARAARERAQAEAAHMRLTAPENALVIRRDGEVGQFIPAGQNVFWLSCCAPLRVTTEVDEEDIPLVKPGQKVLIRADAFREQVFHGEVQSVTPKGDPIARSYRVRVSLEENTPLKIGMTAETNIVITQRENALLVPSTAIRGDTAWIVENGKLARRKLELGARGPEKTEILAGLDENAQLLLNPPSGLEEGQSVRTRPATAEDTPEETPAAP